MVSSVPNESMLWITLRVSARAMTGRSGRSSLLVMAMVRLTWSLLVMAMTPMQLVFSRFSPAMSSNCISVTDPAMAGRWAKSSVSAMDWMIFSSRSMMAALMPLLSKPLTIIRPV